MISKTILERSEYAALQALIRLQNSDGSFHSSTFTKTSSVPETKKTTFYAGLIAQSLLYAKENASAQAMLGKIHAFLVHEKNENWTFNYWSRTSKEYAALPYPDDLDATGVALHALAAHDPACITEDALARIVTTLISTESQEGGPYNTWIFSGAIPDAWKDIDVAVNSNINNFLVSQDIHLESLVTYIESAIDEERYESRYYHDPYAIVYFISKWYDGKRRNQIQSYLLKRMNKDGHWGTPLATACAVSALIRLGTLHHQVEKAISYLVQSQQPDGSWPCEAFFIERISKQEKYYSGAEAVATACCLEAIILYRTSATAEHENVQNSVDANTPLRDAIHDRVRNRFLACPSIMQEALQKRLDHIVKNDPHHAVTLTSYFFHQSLGASNMQLKEVFDLCTVNVLGWIAYTIYDDTIDGDSDGSLLPIANICLRELEAILGTFKLKPAARKTVRLILDQIDGANYTEKMLYTVAVIDNAIKLDETLPAYTTYDLLACKSLGHAIGPYIIAQMSGNAARADLIVSFFKQYLIARQLNDDAHDWYTDMQRGFINPIGAQVLAAWKKLGNDEIVFEQDESALKILFWNECIDQAVANSVYHITTARSLLAELNLMENTLWQGMLRGIEQSALSALSERDASQRFIEAFAKTDARLK